MNPKSLISNTLLFVSITVSALSYGCRPGLNGSGTLARQDRIVQVPSRIDIGGSVQAFVTKSNVASVVVEAEDNLLPFVRTEVSGDTLRVFTTQALNPTKTITIRITSPVLEELDISGTVQAVTRGYRGESLDIHTSGASNLEIADVTTRTLVIDASGASHVTFSTGATEHSNQLTIHASGSSDVNLEPLRATTVAATASGSSRVDVHPLDRLTAQASGAAIVTYGPRPKTLDVSTSGTGSISPRSQHDRS